MNTKIDSLFSTILLLLAFGAVYAAMPHHSASSVVDANVVAQTQTENPDKGR